MEIDRTALAEFLRHRRAALQPEDVGMPRGVRRRTGGLRREEVATLCHMSPDYYARLERASGPRPSEQMIVSMAQGLHLNHHERDHLFRLAGYTPPQRDGRSEQHIAPGLLRILDRLEDTPAEIVTELGETLRQTRMGLALSGDLTGFSGPARCIGYRWFTDPAVRARYPSEDHDRLSHVYVSGLREVSARRGPHSQAAALAEALANESEEFRRLWGLHEVGLRPAPGKRFIHPEVGLLDLECQTLLDPEQSHFLLVYTAKPGSESHEKLQLLSVIGSIQD